MPALNINDYWVRWLQGQLSSTAASDAATIVNNDSGNKANANAVATLPASVTKFTWITGFQCTAAGSTAGLATIVTITGIATPLNFIFTFPIGVLVPAPPLVVTFPQAIPSTAINTPIVVTLPASGGGGTNAACSAFGYQL